MKAKPKSPCRGCDDKSVRITLREFKALVLASDRGRELAGRNRDLEAERAAAVDHANRLGSENKILARELKDNAPGKLAEAGPMIHRAFGEPWDVCPNGWAGQECEYALDYEHRQTVLLEPGR